MRRHSFPRGLHTYPHLINLGGQVRRRSGGGKIDRWKGIGVMEGVKVERWSVERKENTMNGGEMIVRGKK